MTGHGLKTEPSELADASLTGRVIGFDVARSAAMLGMMVVHFSLVAAGDRAEPTWLAKILGLLDGRASATFVILAGIGVTLMARRAVLGDDHQASGACDNPKNAGAPRAVSADFGIHQSHDLAGRHSPRLWSVIVPCTACVDLVQPRATGGRHGIRPGLRPAGGGRGLRAQLGVENAHLSKSLDALWNTEKPVL
jgi:hypothetical protein